MHKGKYVFAQLLDFIDKDVFLRLANKYDGNRYVKQFTCWNQLAVLMFGQLSNRESLRDVVLATQAHASKAYHLGFGKHAAKSTLADANTKRDYRIFEEFAYKVIAEAQRCSFSCTMSLWRCHDCEQLSQHRLRFPTPDRLSPSHFLCVPFVS